MKKSTLVLFFIALSALINVAQSQTKPNFRSIPESVKNGDTIKVEYDTENTLLKNQKAVSAIMYTYQNYKWYAHDVTMKGGANHWSTPVIVPANCGLIAFKFKADTLTDNNNDQGYFLMMHDKKRTGLNAKGAYAGWGLARSPKYNLNIPDYINWKGITDSATYHWLNQEISFNQESKSVLVYPYAVALKATFTDSFGPRLQRVLNYLKRADASEEDLLNARKILLRLLDDKKTADSVDQVINSKFPKGSLARLAAFKAIPTGSDAKLMMTGYRKFLIDFPEAGTNQTFNEENRINYDIIKQNLIIFNSYFEKNYSDLDRYLNELSYSMINNIYYKIVDIPLKRKEVDEKILLQVSDKLVKRLEYIKTHQPENYAYLAPSEWRNMIDMSLVTQISIDHIHLLNTAGRYKETLAYADQAQKVFKYSRAAFNNELATTLTKLNLNARLKTLLEKSVYENQASVEMLAMLKSVYAKNKGKETGYEAYLNGLKNHEGEQKAKADILKERISIPMVDFAMEDLNGKTVKLADLKGKTVVFDFWATWCVPCKASFPGMKLAVERYAKDPNVVFYFVDTEERGDTYKKEIAAYIKANNYPFNVLFDNKMADGKVTGEVFERVSKAFKISGIPQKIVVDGNGVANFISVGFYGSATGLADEISTMVDLTKAGK